MVLRKRLESGYQVNNWLGLEYHYIDREASPVEFEATAKIEFGNGNEDLLKECYGFIVWGRGGAKRTSEKGYFRSINSK